MAAPERVKKLQLMLLQAGFVPGAADGIYGPSTERAVRNLQRYCGLKVDGICGPLTEKALYLLVPHKMGNVRVGVHFSEGEFTCPCCGVVKLNVKLVGKLEKLRSSLGGRPVMVTSGYRCASRNRSVGGAKQSRHMHGDAADIFIEGVAPAKVADCAVSLGFTGVGKYGGFTHVDVRPGPGVRW